MSTPKPDNFMQLFWTLVDGPVWPRCAKNSDEYFTKFIPSKLKNNKSIKVQKRKMIYYKVFESLHHLPWDKYKVFISRSKNPQSEVTSSAENSKF